MHRHLAALSGGSGEGVSGGVVTIHYTHKFQLKIFREYSQQRLCRMCFDQH